MSSSSSSSSSPRPTQQRPAPPQARSPAFADWPTIKILVPPEGRNSRQTDEWCVTYCTQSIRGRIETRTPDCRSLCVRYIFAHEVRNVLSFRRHQEVDGEGKAKYPLPEEGQPVNIPRFLGGKPVDPNAEQPAPPPPKKYWEEGWYLWTTKNTYAALDKTLSMRYDLQRQAQRRVRNEKVKIEWLEYQALQERLANTQDADNTKQYGPPRPFPDTIQGSVLVELPPPFPLSDRLDRVLKPTRNVLGIFQQSIQSGTMERFGRKAWEKAWSNEPWRIAQHALNTAHETLFKGGKRRDDDKDSD